MLRHTHRVAPVMPQAAIDNRVEGFVMIELTIATDGSVKDLEVQYSQPPGWFEAAALAAVSQWRYEPVTRKGEPVAQRTLVRVNFELPET